MLASEATASDASALRGLAGAALRRGHGVTLFLVGDATRSTDLGVELATAGADVAVCEADAALRGIHKRGQAGVFFGSLYDWARMAEDADRIMSLAASAGRASGLPAGQAAPAPPGPPAATEAVAVLVRSADPEVGLQGLRTALSLSMGDRPIALFLVGPGNRLLEAEPGSEAQRCLAALHGAAVPITVDERQVSPGEPAVGVTRKDAVAILRAVNAYRWQQNF